ncbi:MAG: YbaN family protein [Micrococcaceae bacterium]
MLGKQIVFFSIGIVATCLGIAGAILPLIPGGSMILLALWAFSKSNERLHNWLMSLPLLQKTHEEMTHFKHDYSLSIYTKTISQVAAWTSCVVIYFVIGEPWVVAVIGIMAIACSIFMFSVPTRKIRKVAPEVA